MALQLIYTSASAALKPGVTGFATVAQHRGIRAAIVRAIEQRSGYLDTAAYGGKRPAIYSHRRIEAAGERAHVLTRVVASGSDYTGRNNHLAHHLVIAEEELERARVSPADVMRQMKWRDRWDEDPRYFSDADDEINLATMKPQISLPARAWASWPKAEKWDAGCAALPFSANETRDARSFFAVATVEETEKLLLLYGESLLLKDPAASRPALLWQTPFTTLEIQAEDAKEFQWIGCVHGAPRHAELLKQKRSIIELTAASLTPPAGELAEIARDPAAARKAPPPTALAKPAAADLPQKPAPAPDAAPKTTRSKKRSYEEEMMAHIEKADDPAGGSQKWLLPTVIALSVLFLAAVVLKVYQDSQATEARKVATKTVSFINASISDLRKRFYAGEESVRGEVDKLLNEQGSFLARPGQENLRQQLTTLSHQIEQWLEVKERLASIAKEQEQAQPKLSGESLLQELDVTIRQARLPTRIEGMLSQELDALAIERHGMATLMAAKVTPENAAVEKIRLEPMLKGFARKEVKTRMQALFDKLFLVVLAETPKEAPKVVMAPKEAVEKPKAAAQNLAKSSNPDIAALERLPATYVIPRSDTNVFFTAVAELSNVMPELIAPDVKADASPTILLAKAEPDGPDTRSPPPGILNEFANARRGAFHIMGSQVYVSENKPLLNILDGALRRVVPEQVPWSHGARYFISFTKEKAATDAKLPPPLFPNLQLLSMLPASTRDQALSMPPLLRLPAREFLAREGSKIVIKSGTDPDLRKLLGKLRLAVQPASGANLQYEFFASSAPLLKRVDGSLPSFAASSALKPTDLENLWSVVAIDLAAELLKRPVPAIRDGLTAEHAKWKPIADALEVLEALGNKIPANYDGLITKVTYISRDGRDINRWHYPPLVAKDELPTSHPPALIMTPVLGKCPAAVYFEIVGRVITLLDNHHRINLTEEDQTLVAVLKSYGEQSGWDKDKSAWTNVMTAYATLLAASEPSPADLAKSAAKEKEPQIDQHHWNNRKALFKWFERVLSPDTMQKTKAYLIWIPGPEMDPKMESNKREESLKVWRQDDAVANLLEKSPPEKLSVRYTLILSLPFVSPQQTPATAYLKWAEFDGAPEPAIPPQPAPQPAPRPGAP